jgi:hypothetical protein
MEEKTFHFTRNQSYNPMHTSPVHYRRAKVPYTMPLLVYSTSKKALRPHDLCGLKLKLLL